METDFASVTCPTCFQSFDIAAPGRNELPVEWDYDCEICCRPMVIAFRWDGGGVTAEAHSEA